MENSYVRYRVRGISDCPVCDHCGKTNLKRTVILENLESGEVVNFGVDCASTALKQKYMGKRYSISRDCMVSMAKRAKVDSVVVESAN